MKDGSWAATCRLANSSGDLHLPGENSYLIMMKGIHQLVWLGLFGGKIYRESFKAESGLKAEIYSRRKEETEAMDGAEERSVKSYLAASGE